MARSLGFKKVNKTRRINRRPGTSIVRRIRSLKLEVPDGES